jgi:protein ImuA
MREASLRSPDILRKLTERIQAIESGQHCKSPAIVPLGMPALDPLLPDGGLPAGSLVELLSAAEGAGAWTFGLLMARQASGQQKTLVVVDLSGCFYPPAAAKLGVDLHRTIVVHPSTQGDAHAAMNLALRCSAVGAVVAWCDRIQPLEFRRLQLAAEVGTGLGFLLRGSSALRAPSFARWRLLVTPMDSTDASRRIRVDVVRCRGGKDGQSLIVEIDSETGDVRVPAGMAPSATVARTARA